MKTLTVAGPKTFHWTSIMLDLTGLDSDTMTAYTVCWWTSIVQATGKLVTKCCQCSDEFYQTDLHATSIKLVLGVVMYCYTTQGQILVADTIGMFVLAYLENWMG